jgi:hypothetical protein
MMGSLDEEFAMDVVYIETPIISHATARPSSDPATAVLQDQAKRWMVEQRPSYNLVTSQLVVTEAAGGDPEAAARRRAMLADIPILDDNPDIDAVADELISHSLIPAVARLDALHVATAALAGTQYLLTQNCRHIANARVLPRVYRLLNDLGLPGLLICTPIEFLGGSSDDEEPDP